MLVEFEDRILLTRLPRGPKLCGLYVPPVKMRDTAASYRRPAAGTASTKVRFARTGTPVSTGSVASVSAVLGGVAAGAETTLVAIGTVGVGRAGTGRGGGGGGGGGGGRGGSDGGRASGGGRGAGGATGRCDQRNGAPVEPSEPSEAPRWPEERCCDADRLAGFLATSECAGGRWVECLLGSSCPDLVRGLAPGCPDVRLCSTPAVYAVACLASSQPAAILDCTGSTIDLAREAIDETTAAPVEPPRCTTWEGWPPGEAAKLWAAAMASIMRIASAQQRVQKERTRGW